MSRPGRRLRGAVLRLVRHGRVAVAAGALLLTPTIIVMVGEFPWESWRTDGAGLILGATGLALLMAGLGGRRPDWIDPS